MNKWLRRKILAWLTQPDEETIVVPKTLAAPVVKEELPTPLPAPKEEDIIYYKDPTPEGFIKVTELTDTVFEDNIVFSPIEKQPDNGWTYLARYMTKEEMRDQ